MKTNRQAAAKNKRPAQSKQVRKTADAEEVKRLAAEQLRRCALQRFDTVLNRNAAIMLLLGDTQLNRNSDGAPAHHIQDGIRHLMKHVETDLARLHCGLRGDPRMDKIPFGFDEATEGTLLDALAAFCFLITQYLDETRRAPGNAAAGLVEISNDLLAPLLYRRWKREEKLAGRKTKK